MVDFASLNTNVAEVTETELLVGFGKGCSNGQAGLPTTSSYLNAVFQYVCRCLVPKGAIVIWSGVAADVPTGWAICDGQNGTPNLLGKFVMGATDDPNGGGKHSQGTSGGGFTKTTSEDGEHNHGETTGGTALTVAQIPAHAHSATSEPHTHTDTAGSSGGWDGLSSSGNAQESHAGPTSASGFETDEETVTVNIENTGGGEEHDHSISDDGSHTHTVDVTPPYCALYYIMKL